MNMNRDSPNLGVLLSNDCFVMNELYELLALHVFAIGGGLFELACVTETN